jgi:hypothetical protein
VIGRLADATALQKRILNASRGPAVWALRAQTDKRQSKVPWAVARSTQRAARAMQRGQWVIDKESMPHRPPAWQPNPISGAVEPRLLK